ncbi:hypothetical protein RRSWK_01918 [Rhodopirellula sp. SWK7]|nr:hypothetical protein RRSWK_01918 [Rhodopirellula sp. SWK7]
MLASTTTRTREAAMLLPVLQGVVLDVLALIYRTAPSLLGLPQSSIRQRTTGNS